MKLEIIHFLILGTGLDNLRSTSRVLFILISIRDVKLKNM